MEISKELTELRASTETALGALKQIKADCYDNGAPRAICSDDFDKLCCRMQDLFSYLTSRISSLETSFYNYTYEHSKGHLPPIKSVTSMQKLLKVAGMENEYEVYKPTIVVASTRRGSEISATFTK